MTGRPENAVSSGYFQGDEIAAAIAQARTAREADPAATAHIDEDGTTREVSLSDALDSPDQDEAPVRVHWLHPHGPPEMNLGDRIQAAAKADQLDPERGRPTGRTRQSAARPSATVRALSGTSFRTARSAGHTRA